MRLFARLARRLPRWFWAIVVAAAIGTWLYPQSAGVIAIAAGAGIAAMLVLQLGHRLRGPRIRDWEDAERVAAQWLRKAGCRRVSLTGGSADGGIDVITAAWAVQVKHTAKRVGRPAVQQTVGAAMSLDRRPALISTSGFTSHAFDYALEHDVALVELDLNGAAQRANRAARAIGRRRFARFG